MAMSVGGRGGGTKSEINVTPLVDVCLVLLIIFMVLVPRNVPEISVRIPPESKQPERQQKLPEEPLVIGMSKEGGLSLNHNPIQRDQLPAQLTRQLEFRGTKAVFVDFDAKSKYGDAVEIIDLAKRSGAEIVAILKKKDEVIPRTLRGL